MNPKHPIKDDPFALAFLPRSQAEVHASADGTVFIWRPARTVFVSRVVGGLSDQAAAALEATLRRVIGEDKRHIGFHDWEEMTDYTIAGRLRLTIAVGDALRATDGIHVLTRSKTVALGVQISNLVVKNMSLHSNRAGFEHALREELRKRGSPR